MGCKKLSMSYSQKTDIRFLKWGIILMKILLERVCMCVCLTAVDSLEARVISRFPFSPSSAGTRMKISVMYWNASQCCGDHRELHRHYTSQFIYFLLLWGSQENPDIPLPSGTPRHSQSSGDRIPPPCTGSATGPPLRCLNIRSWRCPGGIQFRCSNHFNWLV